MFQGNPEPSITGRRTPVRGTDGRRPCRLITLIVTLALALSSLCGSAFAVSQLQQRLPQGWSLVSVPLAPLVNDVTAVFADLPENTRVKAYRDGSLLAPAEPTFTTVEPGRGFWVFNERAETLAVLGNLSKPDAAYDIPIRRGWNLIGNPWAVAVPWSDESAAYLVAGSTDPQSISEAATSGHLDRDLRGYDAGTSDYYPVRLNSATPELLHPWRGYLLHADTQGTLRLTPPPADNRPPVVELLTPEPNAEITGIADVIGTASDTDLIQYILLYAYAGSDDFIPIFAGNESIVDATLGRLDSTMFLNGQYRLRLLAEDLAGNRVGVERTILVEGEQKVGLYTLSFVDLDIPVSSMPIQVQRTYDSRDKRVGDFGVGWSLEVGNIQIQENRIMGAGWNGTRSGGGFPTYCIEPAGKHVVSIAYPDGTIQRFEPVLTPSCQSFFPIQTVTVSFRPVGNSQGRLQIMDDTSPLVLGNYPGSLELLHFDTAELYNPQHYRYTTHDDVVLEFSKAAGLHRVTDPSGNTLTITPNGIQHSLGKSVVFERDALGRIARLIDPLGHAHHYEYDSRGDLARVVDPLGNATTFTYNRKHDLLDVVDPLGNRAVRNEYDENGRILATIDAKGNRVEFSYDIEGKQQIVRDPRGNLTRYVYDDNGNILVEEMTVTLEGETVLATTLREYDDADNEIVTVDPDGVRTEHEYDSNRNRIRTVVDPGGLDLTTLSDYGGGCCRLRFATDPDGHTTEHEYDDGGQLIARTDPLGHTTTYVVDEHGRELREIDALGNYSENAFDDRGNLAHESRYDAADTLLSRKSYTYDAAGNRLTETEWITIDGVLTPSTIAYAYDALGNVLAATDALGGVTRYEYDAANRRTAEIDPLGLRTETEYDTRGQVVRTRYPDGTEEEHEYDALGNKILERARTGLITRYEYDQLNRSVRILHPDDTVEETLYTPGGRVLAVIDRRGFRTDYEYDAAGRRIREILPAVFDPETETFVRPVIESEYNNSGRRTAVVNALGHRTEEVLDAGYRPIVSRFPDGATAAKEYDPLNRVTREIDTEGRATDFEYDALGRLVAVVLPAPATGEARPRTEYAYDETGNRLTETNPLGHTTRFVYDLLGREVARILPDGASQTREYDLAGRLIRRVDYNGDATQYDYDDMDRLVRTLRPDGSTVEFAYTAHDQIRAMTDALGVTTWEYDSLDRLSREVRPDGAFIEYGYDAAGNRTRVRSPAGEIFYSYDALSRLIRVAENGNETRIFYDLAGNRKRQLTLPAWILTEYEYDSANRLTSMSHSRVNPDSSVTPIESYTYALAPSGRREGVVESDGSAVDYVYDGLDRLVGEIRTGAHPYALEYAYDLAGNRTRMTRNGIETLYQYDERDRLIAEGVAVYSHDANGNTIRREEGAAVAAYDYDSENRLVRLENAAGVTVYIYDGRGELVEVRAPGQTRRLLVDRYSQTGFSQTLEERDANGDLIAHYLYSDDLLAQRRGGETAYYLYDGQMSTRLLAGADGEITDTWVYDAFGRTIASTGVTPNPYLYTGERFDPNSGFYYLRARFYNPLTGTFPTMDPFGGRIRDPMSLHKYLYTHNNPVNSIDPSGESLISLAIGGIQSGLSRVASAFNSLQFLCRVKSGLNAASEIWFWSQVLAAAIAFTDNWKVGAKFDVSRRVNFDPKAVKKIEVRTYFNPNSRTPYIQINVERVSGLRLQFDFNLGDYRKSTGKFGKNYKISEFTLCGTSTIGVKIELAVRFDPSGLDRPFNDPNATALDFAMSYWSISIDATVLDRWKASFPILGKYTVY